MFKSVFAIHEVDSVNKKVFIVDQNSGALSVTNDAENVVLFLLSQYGSEYRFVYYDSMGIWDELVHDGKKFTRFREYTG